MKANQQFLIDQTKCIRCKLCVAVCPLLEVATNEEIAYVDDIENLCTKCGHCVAICPKGAASIPNMVPDDCEIMTKNWNLNQGKIASFFKGRRSIRRYKNEKINKVELAKLIDIARYAPTAGNTQSVKWLVFSSENEIKKIAQLTFEAIKELIEKKTDVIPEPFVKKCNLLVNAWESGRDLILNDAPHVVMVYGPNFNGVDYTNGVIALTYFELVAAASKIGTTWSGFVSWAANEYKSLKEYLNLTKDHACYGTVMCGYQKHQYERIPTRNAAQVIWR